MSDADNDDKTQVLSRPRAPTTAPAPPGRLRCVDTSVLKGDGGAEIILEGSLVTVGRGRENDVALNAEGISRHHARLVAGDGAWQVEDLGSTNGTRINNSRIEGTRVLGDGDTVAFGRVCYKYSVIESDESETTGSHSLDLGGGEQTMIMRPGAAKAAMAAPAGAASSPTQRADGAPAKRAPGDTASRRKTTPPPSSGSNASLWVIVVLVAAGIAAGAAFALGLI